jgi:RNA polymerase sigma-70 factor (ECF subfamily)
VADSRAEARLDQALVLRVLAGHDRRAFEHLLRRHQGMVRAQLRRLLHGDAALADDLAQETFLLAWRKLHQFRGDASFSTWLYRIAYCCFLQARRKKPWAAEETCDDEAGQPQLLHPGNMRLDIERALQRLSAAEQTVLLHCVQLGLSHGEAAYVLAMPLGTVKAHATRGKAKLRALLADWRDETHKEQTA